MAGINAEGYAVLFSEITQDCLLRGACRIFTQCPDTTESVSANKILDKAELIDLTEEVEGQLADGVGEHLEQQVIKLGEDKVYISFWNSGDNYFIKPESEVFPEQALEHTMGGMA